MKCKQFLTTGPHTQESFPSKRLRSKKKKYLMCENAMTLYILDNDFLSAQVIPVQKSVDDDFQAPIVSAFNYVPLKKSGNLYTEEMIK